MVSIRSSTPGTLQSIGGAMSRNIFPTIFINPGNKITVISRGVSNPPNLGSLYVNKRNSVDTIRNFGGDIGNRKSPQSERAAINQPHQPINIGTLPSRLARRY